MARKLDPSQLEVETFTPQAKRPEARGWTTSICDTDNDCSTVCIAATNVCEVCG